jgi:hypothetical protein
MGEPVPPDSTLETDDRFPSGPWKGFYIQWGMQGRQRLNLTFREGVVTGYGSDPGGDFHVRGTYDPGAGRARLTKMYAQHRVEYDGHAEGDGIWGRWEIRGVGYTDRGGFHIWPDADGESRHDDAEAEEPVGVGTRPGE